MLAEGVVFCGGGKGTGALRLNIGNFRAGDFIRVHSKPAIYFPKKITDAHNIIKTSVKLELKKATGFAPKFGKDRCIYLPLTEAKKLNLR